jgi:hypothetical protein
MITHLRQSKYMEANEFGSPDSQLWVAALQVGVRSGDLNPFLDNGLVVVVNPLPVGANLNSYSFAEPLGDEELKPATGVSCAFNHAILLGRRMDLSDGTRREKLDLRL